MKSSVIRIVLALLMLGAVFSAAQVSAQTKAPAPAETLDTVKLTEVESLKVQNFKQQQTILIQQQQLLQRQFNDTQAALQKLSVDAKAEFEKIAADHKLKDVTFDPNAFALVPAKNNPAQNATPSSSK